MFKENMLHTKQIVVALHINVYITSSEKRVVFLSSMITQSSRSNVYASK